MAEFPATMNVPDGYALVGSSNFTRAGLTQNIELNVQVRDDVDQLQEWFEKRWEDAEDITNALLEVMEMHCKEGESESGNIAGEIDIQICIEGLPIVMIEALKLESIVDKTLSAHINKVLTKYDPNGCSYAILIVYAKTPNFEAFYNRIQVYLRKFEYPYEKQTDIEEVSTDYSELKHAQMVLQRNGTKTRVHFLVANII